MYLRLLLQPLSALIGLLLCLGCQQKESTIIIVDIGQLNRAGLAEQLRLVNDCRPRVIGLDFHLTTDSLAKDTALVREIARAENLVQISELHNYIDVHGYWDSLEVSHPKFGVKKNGFSNFSTYDDAYDDVVVTELPMRQQYWRMRAYAFSYVVALNAFGVKPEYEKHTYEDFEFEPFGRHFKIISANDLLNMNFTKSDLQNKVVLMGYVGETEDSFFLDHARTNRISGVEVHANFIEQIMK